MKRLTQAEFVARAVAVHGTRYDYSFSEYVDNTTKLKIVCAKHGIFEQTPKIHTRGNGCNKCGEALTGRKNAGTTAGFIKRAIAKHGAKYDYSIVLYGGPKSKVSIICPQHGLFKQAPRTHLRGSGCRRCGVAKQKAAVSRDTAAFVEKALVVHKGRYDYSRAVYSGSHNKLLIICPKHGEFEQGAAKHLEGQGCPFCKQYAHRLHWIEQAAGRKASLYLIRVFSSVESFYKVGITYHTVSQRYRGAALNGYQYEVLAQHTSQNAAAVWDWEQSILETFAHLRYQPKTSFEGETECFSNCDEILNIFPL